MTRMSRIIYYSTLRYTTEISVVSIYKNNTAVKVSLLLLLLYYFVVIRK